MIIIIINREERNSFSTNLSISPHLWVGQWGEKLDLASLQLACHPLSCNSPVAVGSQESGVGFNIF
jgi:hypothetical protein